MDSLGESLVSAVCVLDGLVSELNESVDKLEVVKEELRRGAVRGVDIGDGICCVEKEIKDRSALVQRVGAYKVDALKDLYACVYDALGAVAQRVSRVLPCGSLDHLDEAEVGDEAKTEEALRKAAYIALFGGLTEEDNVPGNGDSAYGGNNYGGHYLRYPDLAKGDRTPKHVQDIYHLFLKAREAEASKIQCLDAIMETMEASCEAGFPLGKALRSLASQRLTMAKHAKQTDDALLKSVNDIQCQIRSKVEGWSSGILEGSYASIGHYLDC